MKSLYKNDLKILDLRLRVLLKISISLSLFSLLNLRFVNSLTLVLIRLIRNFLYSILKLLFFYLLSSSNSLELKKNTFLSTFLNVVNIVFVKVK